MENEESKRLKFKDYADKIVSELHRKYRQDFVVDGLGGLIGTHDDTTIKAWCHCTEGKFKDYRFFVEIGKDDLQVKDSFGNLIVAQMISRKIQELLFTEGLVVSQVETPTKYYDGKIEEENDEIPDFFENAFVTSFVFLPQSVDDEMLSERIYEFGVQLVNLHLKDLSVILFVTKEMDEDKIWAKFCSSGNKYDAFSSDEAVIKISGFQVNKNGMLTSAIDIRKEFCRRK